MRQIRCMQAADSSRFALRNDNGCVKREAFRAGLKDLLRPFSYHRLKFSMKRAARARIS
jgi:hypothetical protein